MKPFSHIVRRTHLYLALLCLPWLVMYGVSSVAFSHPDWFPEGPNLYDPNSGAWTDRGSWRCTLPPPEKGSIPRAYGSDLLEVAGIEADAFYVFWAGERRVEVHTPTFFYVERLAYDLDEQTLRLQSRRPILQHVLTSMHARAGYQHDGILNDAWAVMVDLSAIGFLLWVVTGFIIWWQLPDMRFWGFAALGLGVALFVVVLMRI